MAQEDRGAALQTKFDAAVRVIRSLPADGPYQASDNMILMFYSYYMQATNGPCNLSRPGFWDSAGRAKWDAWQSLGAMTEEEAMTAYVDDIQLILETLPVSEEVSELLEVLGNFYEEVEDGAGEEEEVVRPFTRAFSCAAEFQKPLMAGFGDLWEAIQKPDTKGPATGSEVTETAGTGSDVTVVALADQAEDEELRTVEGSSEEEEDGSYEDEDAEDGAELDGDDDEERDQRPSDLHVLRGEEWHWGSEGSVTASVSSATYGTNSSLNSEVEEEELLRCCAGPARAGHINGHLTARGDRDSPTLNFRAADSDNEEFCDSMEHQAMEEASGTSRVLSLRSVRKRDLQQDNTILTLSRGVGAARLQEDPPSETRLGIDQPSSSLSSRGRVSGAGSRSSSPVSGCYPASVAGPRPAWPGSRSGLCRADGEAADGGTETVASGDLNAQIAMALARLQHGMDSVLQRLDNLEALTASQARLLSQSHDDHGSLPLLRQKRLWWPFHLSPVAMAFTTVWPLVAHWLVLLYLKRKKRKLS